jgi:hypothetical protein
MSAVKLQIGRIILIDDDKEQLADLHKEVEAALASTECTVESWYPEEADILDAFHKMIEPGATLVVTDYDLTKGASGFFGTSVVAWCQRQAIPVGDYSRGNRKNMPSEPNLYEFRYPSTTKEAARQIAATFRGFKEIFTLLSDQPDLLKAPSPANMLADLLGQPAAVSAFSLYAPQVGANAGLVDLVVEDRSDAGRLALSTYILGHMLFNSILRFPGPILDAPTVCSYFAARPDQFGHIAPKIEAASYKGPFAELQAFYWRHAIDDLIETWAETSTIEYPGHSASYRRALIEEQLGGQLLERFGCPRCNGELGGYRCPFTHAVVCERGDCSVGSSGWIPIGADLTRVERQFYDEIAPMLGS